MTQFFSLDTSYQCETVLDPPFQLSRLLGKPTLLIILSKESSYEVEPFMRQAGDNTNGIGSINIVAAFHGSGIPALFRGMAKNMATEGAEKLRAAVCDNYTNAGIDLPDDETQIAPFLLDWNGKIADMVGCAPNDTHIAVAVLDQHGKVIKTATRPSEWDTILNATL